MSIWYIHETLLEKKKKRECLLKEDVIFDWAVSTSRERIGAKIPNTATHKKRE